MYFKDNKYSEFVEFLKSQNPKEPASLACAAYYIALSRNQQLKYWEEKQNWDEYFAQGNAFRDEIAANLQKAIEGTSAKDTINIYSRLLWWQFHKDMQDNLNEQALQEGLNSITATCTNSAGNTSSDVSNVRLNTISSYIHINNYPKIVQPNSEVQVEVGWGNVPTDGRYILRVQFEI